MIVSVFDPAYKAHEYRAWLDGVEVTSDCQVAIVDEPDEAGAVLLLLRDTNGRHYRDPATGAVAREWRRGLVVIHGTFTQGNTSAPETPR